jgi:peptidoglycan-N-acetylglucosamine deacetylase
MFIMEVCCSSMLRLSSWPMHRYFIKTPWWLRKLYSNYVWRMNTKEREVFLTFDDGPHPQITPWVLDQLAQYDAKASFFCIGQNVERYPDVYREIMAQGHSIGNHTHHHLNGWRTKKEIYWQDISTAAGMIDTDLFRPPYGRIKKSQAKGIAQAMNRERARIIMWDVLSGDFDRNFSPEKCVQHVLKHVEPGSIVVFHDSEKAFPNLKEMLPEVLKKLKAGGYKCRPIQ